VKLTEWLARELCPKPWIAVLEEDWDYWRDEARDFLSRFRIAPGVVVDKAFLLIPVGALSWSHEERYAILVPGPGRYVFFKLDAPETGPENTPKA